MNLSLKRIAVIVSVVAGILLIPLIAMQFSNEVHWTVLDFAVGGFVLLCFGLLLDIILRKVKQMRLKALALSILILSFLLLWAELAVGIF
jgi:hypothetical protein